MCRHDILSPMSSQKFFHEYRKLNTEQKAAVDTTEGPVMVIAGPGTGKTQILTLRIANILRTTDTPPDAILALTFTESGVFSMRRRLVDLIGSAGYRVAIHTFHGFANDVIQNHPDEFPRIVGAAHSNDVDQITLLGEIITENSFQRLKPFGNPLYYVPAIKRKISELKREAVTPEDVRRICTEDRAALAGVEKVHASGAHAGTVRGEYAKKEKQCEKNEEFYTVYERYEQALTERDLYDYEDMIMEAVRALETNEDLLRELQETYLYLLADEHQDSNNAQNRLLELLSRFHDQPNLFVVGDEKQAIFRFQGASLENFLYFKTQFPQVQTVTLKNNYRSTQAVLDAAHSTIEKGITEDERLARVRKTLRQPLAGARGIRGDAVRLASFEDPERESMFIAREARRLIEEGVPPHEIAVLYRNNRDADTIAAVFERERVPFAIESDQNVLADADIQKFLTLLRAVHRIGDDELLMRVLHIDFFNIAPIDIYAISRYSWRQRVSLYTILRSRKMLQEAGVHDGEGMHRIYTLLSSWNTLAHNRGVLALFERVAQESGFLGALVQHTEAVEKLEKLHGFYRDIEALVATHRSYTLSDVLHYVSMLEEYNVSISKRKRPVTPRGVRLMTAHKSKGLEFDYVFIAGAYDGHWGNTRSSDHFPISYTQAGASGNGHAIDDERRLFYVALTRARLAATITYPRTAASGKQQLPCQFIGEIDAAYIREENTESFEKTISPALLMAPRERVAVPAIEDAEFLRALFIEQGLSVTALNNYLACPWRYFYSNLLRVPKAPNRSMAYGTAVHAALKYYADAVRAGEDIGAEGLLAAFEAALGRLPLQDTDYADALEKGKRTLAGYIAARRDRWGADTLAEFKARIVFDTETEEAGRIPLRGDLDKIEMKGGTAHVVDYKTSKPKTRNDIEGNTKTSTGDYKRQLVFYKLLLDAHDESAPREDSAKWGKYAMQSGEVDFVEPDDKGRYRSETFFITDEEVAELKQTIRDAAKEIASLDFWNRRCDPKASSGGASDKKCESCALRDMMG